MDTSSERRRRREDDRVIVIAGGFFIILGLANYAFDHSTATDVVLSALAATSGLVIVILGLVRIFRPPP